MPRFLYLVRHGEQQDAAHGVQDGPLGERGKRQATAIADRLGGVPFTGAWTSPLQPAEETAAVITERLPALDPQPSALLMDCIPSGPSPDMPPAFQPFFRSIRPEQIEAGTAQMADAVAEWFTPSLEERHDLLITHNFVIAWFVREAFGADPWRWMGINQANCALTIIRIRSVKPPVLITHNDLGHLPVELRTGLPVPQPY
jgi:broad specificity phosphatase PhoE